MATADTKAQEALFDQQVAPDDLPTLSTLRPSPNLLAVFNDVHNYIYANEGLLKEKIFHEIVELLLLKLADEQGEAKRPVRFGITAAELDEVRQAGASASFESRVMELLDEVRQRYPELFPDNRRVGLRPATLAYVVAALQPYSLSETPGDAKGQAFQTFVYANQRGDRGEYFTPDPVVRVAVGIIDPKPGELVADPACGSAGFLVQTLRHVTQHHSLDTDEKQSYVRECLRGMEFNPDVARSAGIRMTFEGGQGHEVECLDSLRVGLERQESFNVVVTNPPFGSKGKVTDREVLAKYDLGHKWREHNGALEKTDELDPQTPEVLFIELCLRLLKPGGRLAIVLPDGFLQNSSTRYIRAWLERKALVRAVVSVPQAAFVPYGTGIKTSVLVVEKSTRNDRDSVFMARFDRIGYDSKGHPVYARDEAGQQITDERGEPIIDDEADAIAAAFHKWSKAATVETGTDSYFAVPPQALNSRLDAEHYLPADLGLIESLHAAEAKPLADLADFVTKGDRFRRSDDEITYIALSDVDPRTSQIVSSESIAAFDAPSRATYRLREGDIVTATSGASTGTARHVTALVTKEHHGSIASNGFAVIRNVHDVNPLYLLAYMRTPVFLRQVRRLLTGHAIPAVSLDDLRGVLVPIPSTEEQERIASGLEDLLRLRRASLRVGQELLSDTTSVLAKCLKASAAIS